MWNTVISPNFLIWKFGGKGGYRIVWGKCAFPKHFHSRILSEVKAFWIVITSESSEMLQSTRNLNSTGSGQSWKWNYVFSYNFGQNIVGKFMKLSKVCFLWNVLQLTFCNFLTQLSKLAFWLPAWYFTCHQFQAFKGFVWNSLIS